MLIVLYFYQGKESSMTCSSELDSLNSFSVNYSSGLNFFYIFFLSFQL